MNINSLRKNYDGLTAKERFAASVAAGMRGDEQEQDALMKSAPKLTFYVKHHFGLASAFDCLGMLHQIRQLANAGDLLMTCRIMNDVKNQDDVFLKICILAEKHKTGMAAWIALCKEYGIDPIAPLIGLPGDSILEMANMIADNLYDDQNLSD